MHRQGTAGPDLTPSGRSHPDGVTEADDTSGNRWEPPSSSTPPVPVPVPVPVPAARSRRPSWLTGVRMALAGALAAVLLVGGVGGFALGRVTADDNGGSTSDENGVPTGSDRDGDGDGRVPRGPGGPGSVPDQRFGQGPGTGSDQSESAPGGTTT